MEKLISIPSSSASENSLGYSFFKRREYYTNVRNKIIGISINSADEIQILTFFMSAEKRCFSPEFSTNRSLFCLAPAPNNPDTANDIVFKARIRDIRFSLHGSKGQITKKEYNSMV
jgi:hypothetical protein